MSNCCTPQPKQAATATLTACPTSAGKGKRVNLTTLKSLLTPEALATLDPAPQYFFCPDAACDTVYFSSAGTYEQQHIKVPVFQKSDHADVPVCYCFAWTRASLADALAKNQGEAVPAQIAEHVRAGRCSCDVNNPQGSCCLGNIRQALTKLAQEQVAGVCCAEEIS